MLRVAFAIALASWVAIAPGEATRFADSVCAGQCDDDDSEGRCESDCADCACCPHVRLVFAVAEMKIVSVRVSARAFVREQREPVAPAPHEILHVPKSSRLT